jgi:hypothetical protein
MHKCELTDEQLQAAIAYDLKLSGGLGAGPETRKNSAQLADALQELLDRRADAVSEFRMVESTMAYDSAISLIDGCVLLAAEEGQDWHDLADFAEGSRGYLLDAVAYLNQRGLLDRHPDHPTWISVLDEDEPRAEGPLDPAPEVI